MALAGLTALLSGPTLGSEPKDLGKAARCVQWMMRPSNLSRSPFAYREPAGKPSDYVSYLFSDLGVNDWPYHELEAPPESIEREQANAIRMPLLPDGVSFQPRELDRDGGRQLVIRADDERGVIILEGYESPDEAPVLEREIALDLPAADPDAARFNRLVAEDQADMGYSPDASFEE